MRLRPTLVPTLLLLLLLLPSLRVAAQANPPPADLLLQPYGPGDVPPPMPSKRPGAPLTPIAFGVGCTTPPLPTLPTIGYTAFTPAAGRDWHLERDCHGALDLVGHGRRGNPVLWSMGLGTWMLSWALASGFGIYGDGEIPNLYGLVPLAGPWITLALANHDSAVYAGAATTAFNVVDGLAQLAGVTAFVVGVALGPSVEHAPVQLVPITLGSGRSRNGSADAGAGFAIRGRF